MPVPWANPNGQTLTRGLEIAEIELTIQPPNRIPLMKPIFSVVVPIYNLRRTIDLLLRCLEAQTLANEQFECILVDDSSTDGCVEALKNYHPRINLKRRYNAVNLGRSLTRNVGWREAEGEYVVFLDGDMLPAPEWLAGFQEEIARNPAEVISGGRYSIDIGSRSGDLTQRLASLAETGAEDLFDGEIAAQFQILHERARLGPYPNLISEKLETQLREVCRAHPTSMLCAYSFITSNIAVRTCVLKKTSGFSPFLRRGEDTDLGLRLWEMGARFGFAEAARAYHLYDSRQPDRGISLAERLAFFYRHPYSPNLMIAFWTAYNSPSAPPAPFPVLNTLQSIAGGGKELRKKNLSQEFFQLYRRPVPANCQYTKSEIAEYFHEVSGVSPQQMGEYLDLALEKELFIIEKDNKIYFDINHTSNWLKRATPYQEYELRHASYGRTRKTAFQKSGDTADLTSIKCRGKYELNISVRGREHLLYNAALSIPTPVESVYQSEVGVGKTVPDNLMSFYDQKKGVITLPLNELNGGDQIHISYEFSCQTHEFTVLSSDATTSHEIPTPEHRTSTLPLEYKRKAEAMLKKIVPATIDDPYRIAKRIYQWILNNTIYLQSPPTPNFLFFDTGFGSCVHMAGMFVNLCRLAQIPARERSSALFLRVDESEGLLMKNLTRGYSPFTHTWAEFYTPERGWAPIDFLSWGYGGRVLSALNVVDEALRAEIESDTKMYDEYYFGSMDPYRIHVSETAGKAQFLTMKQSTVNDATMQEILSQTRHRLCCEFSTLGR
jgi:glycosyltransferase involved in cell wall biosynthesis